MFLANTLQKQREQYTITVVGKVQEVGFRGYLTDLCRSLRVPSIVYNTIDELKLLCEADEETIKKLASGIRDYRLAEIRDLSIDKGLRLPYPTVRGVVGIEEEIYNRLDEGVKILYSIKEDTKKLDKLDEIDSTTKRIDKKLDKLDKLDEISDTLKKISEK